MPILSITAWCALTLLLSLLLHQVPPQAAIVSSALSADAAYRNPLPTGHVEMSSRHASNPFPTVHGHLFQVAAQPQRQNIKSRTMVGSVGLPTQLEPLPGHDVYALINVPVPLGARVTDVMGVPLPHTPVIFQITVGSGILAESQVITNDQGEAITSITTLIPLETICITMTVADLEPIVVTATGVTVESLRLIQVAGDNQVAAPGQELEEPFVVRVVSELTPPPGDVCGNLPGPPGQLIAREESDGLHKSGSTVRQQTGVPVAGVRVIAEIIQGEATFVAETGQLPPSDMAEAVSDTQGEARFALRVDSTATGDIVTQISSFQQRVLFHTTVTPIIMFNVPVRDMLETGTDIDFFAFEGPAGAIVRLSVRSGTPGLDPHLEVRAPDGTVLVDTWCDGYVGGAVRQCSFSEDVTLPLTGFYLVILSDVKTDEPGEYEIGLQCLFGLCFETPLALAVFAPTSTLTADAPQLQLTTIGTLSGGTEIDLTLPETGTSYHSANTSMASVTPEGLVQAVASGTVRITAMHEALRAVIPLTVELTTDSDGDGLPDDFEQAHAMAPGGANLARFPGTQVVPSSSFAGFPPERTIDGNLHTSWFTARGDAANLGAVPFLEMTFPQDERVGQVQIFGNRESADGFDFLEGILEAFDASGTMLFTSGAVALPAPSRDIVIPVNRDGVRQLRLTATADESDRPGLAEWEVLQREGGPGFSANVPEDGLLDFDRDGLTNRLEFALGTNPFLNDTDGDGRLDGEEFEVGADPLEPTPREKTIVTCEPQSPHVSLDFGQVIRCELGPPTDLDTFSFSGMEGDEVRIVVLSTTAGLDPRLEIQAPDGTVLADIWCDGYVGGAVRQCSFSEDVTLPLTGPYLLHISDVKTDETGEYELSLQCLLGSCRFLP